MLKKATILLSNTLTALALTIAVKMPDCDGMLGQQQDGYDVHAMPFILKRDLTLLWNKVREYTC
jgi:hypothetical protein